MARSKAPLTRRTALIDCRGSSRGSLLRTASAMLAAVCSWSIIPASSKMSNTFWAALCLGAVRVVAVEAASDGMIWVLLLGLRRD